MILMMMFMKTVIMGDDDDVDAVRMEVEDDLDVSFQPFPSLHSGHQREPIFTTFTAKRDNQKTKDKRQKTKDKSKRKRKPHINRETDEGQVNINFVIPGAACTGTALHVIISSLNSIL